ncbi:MAG: hypothetical protein AAF206_01280 [Bacteroidota bacterium]
MQFLLRIIFCLIFLSGLASVAFGQKIFEQDVVYLKNGSIIRGEITEQKLGESVSIQLITGEVYVFSHQDIEKITVEGPKFSKIRLRYRKDLRTVYYRKPGLYNSVSFGLAFNESRWGGVEAFPSLQYKVHYHVNQFVNVGLGAALDGYGQGLIVPLFGELSGDLLRRKVTPFYLLNAGWGIGAAPGWQVRRLDGKAMGMAAVGLKFRTYRRTEFLFSVGFKFQDSYQEFQEFPQDWWTRPQVQDPPLVKGTRRYQKIMFQFGVAF